MIYHREKKKINLEPGGKVLINTGLKIKLPDGHYGRIAPRSGLSLSGIDVLAGVIDNDFRGQVKVFLINLGKENFVINLGDRIAQLIIEKNTTPPVIEVEKIIEKSERGDDGFGSSGIKPL